MCGTMVRRGILTLWALGLALGLTPTGQISQAAGGGAKVNLPPGEMPLVALTFDDGPRNATTARLLEGLAVREVQVTFFLVGSRIPGSEELLKIMVQDGHQIGIHTYDHEVLTKLSRRDFDLQVGKTRSLLTHNVGGGDYWLRPPYGIIDCSVLKWADGPVILWAVDPEDWKDSDIDRIVACVVEQVKDGDIVLMHDIYHSSVDAALRIVDELLSRGYCFVTVEQLMQLRQVAPEKGKLYTALPPKEKN